MKEKYGCLIFIVGYICVAMLLMCGASLLGNKLWLHNKETSVNLNKDTSIYKEYALVRVDDSDRILVSKEWFELVHTSKNIDIIINNEKYLGRYEFEICDSLKCHYLIGEQFLKRCGVRLFVYIGDVKCLYTNNDNDIELYKEAMRCIETCDKDKGIELFSILLRGRILSNMTALDALDCFSMEQDKEKRIELFELFHNNTQKNLDYYSRNKVGLYIF